MVPFEDTRRYFTITHFTSHIILLIEISGGLTKGEEV